MAYLGQIVPDGIEPPLPGCRPGVVAAGPRDQNQTAQMDSPRVAPGFPTCEAGVFLLDDEPDRAPKRKPRDSNSQSRSVGTPVFGTGSSSSRMTSVNQPLAVPGVGIEPTATCFRDRYRVPAATTPEQTQESRQPSQHQVRGEGVEPSSPGSKPGSLPLADPRSRSRRVPCGNRTRVSSLEG